MKATHCVVPFAAFSLLGCSPQSEPPTTRAESIRVAASDHAIPEEWLLAIGYQAGRLEIPGTDVDDEIEPDELALTDDTIVDEAGEGIEDDPSPLGTHDDLDERFGVMHLSGTQITRAAAITGRDARAIETEIYANIDATAALLADGQDLRDTTVQLLGVVEDPDAAQLALEDLDDTIATGFDLITSDGEHVVLDGTSGGQPRAALRPGAYPNRQWIRSPNYSSRLGYSIRYIVVHDIEGTMAGAVAVFKRSSSEASAHYIVRARDGHIVQMVREGDNAWHSGHGWFNRHSIGIEHEGFAHRKNGGGYYNQTQYEASAALSCAIARRNHIPIDRKHVFGHYNVPSSTGSHTLCSDSRGIAGSCGGVSHHSDPGRYWKWNRYMNLVKDCVAAAAP